MGAKEHKTDGHTVEREAINCAHVILPHTTRVVKWVVIGGNISTHLCKVDLITSGSRRLLTAIQFLNFITFTYEGD